MSGRMAPGGRVGHREHGPGAHLHLDADYVRHVGGTHGLHTIQYPNGTYKFCVSALTINGQRRQPLHTGRHHQLAKSHPDPPRSHFGRPAARLPAQTSSRPTLVQPTVRGDPSSPFLVRRFRVPRVNGTLAGSDDVRSSRPVVGRPAAWPVGTLRRRGVTTRPPEQRQVGALQRKVVSIARAMESAGLHEVPRRVHALPSLPRLGMSCLKTQESSP